MNTFVKGANQEMNQTVTENGMYISKSSENALVDLFFAIGGSRGHFDMTLFKNAYEANQDVAIRITLYARDIRGGMGERQTFREIMNYLANHDYVVAKRVIRKIPEVGRWDDLLSLIGTLVEKEALGLYAEALNSGNGLAAKWAPREKSSKKLWASKLRNFMGLTSKDYRKLLVKNTSVVETPMSQKDYSEVDYNKLPSLASIRYQKAFERNDQVGYEAYKQSLMRGDEGAKINAGAVFPYDVAKSVQQGGDADVAQKQWESLPDYIPEGASFLPLIDVSASMGIPAGGNPNLRCMDVAVSLGLYCAQRNKSAFKDMFLNFTTNPTFHNVHNMSLKEALRAVYRSEWGGSTNLQKAYERILEVAVQNNVPQEDMPQMLIVFSDMQFDMATGRASNHPQAAVQQMFKRAGYEVPVLVYWNLNEKGANAAVKFDKQGAALVSGFSPSLMTSVLGADMSNITPLNIVLDAVNQERYNWK